MAKIAILTCSNAGLDYLDYPQDITILRSVIHFGEDESYEDFVQMDAKEFYGRIDKKPDDIPKTSYVSVGLMEEIFEQLYKEGYTDAIVITISSKLSGLYNAVLNVSRDTNIKVHAYDSKNIAYIQALMVLKAHEMVNSGSSVADVFETLDKYRENNKWYFAVDTLKYLIKNGRLSKFSGTLGTFLKIKPLLEIDKEGAVNTIEKIRTTHKALARVLEKYLEDTKDKNVLTYISHAHSDEYAKLLIEKINEVYPQREVKVSYLTPVVGAHTGPKAIGLGFLDLDKVS